MMGRRLRRYVIDTPTAGGRAIALVVPCRSPFPRHSNVALTGPGLRAVGSRSTVVHGFYAVLGREPGNRTYTVRRLVPVLHDSEAHTLALNVAHQYRDGAVRSWHDGPPWEVHP